MTQITGNDLYLAPLETKRLLVVLLICRFLACLLTFRLFGNHSVSHATQVCLIVPIAQ